MTKNHKSIFDLTGRVAIVTGGLGILGQVFCRALVDFGANVVVADLDEQGVRCYAQVLSERSNRQCEGWYCDVNDLDSIEALVEKTVQTFGFVHILHNNAASKSDDLPAFFASAEEYSLEQWRKVMSVNLDGVFFMSRAVGRQMIRQGVGGSIIHTGSIYGQLGSDPRIYMGSEYMGFPLTHPPYMQPPKLVLLVWDDTYRRFGQNMTYV